VIETRQRTAAPEVIRVAGLEIRPQERLALADGRTVPLSTHELGLLAELARSHGRIVSREDLYAAVWRAPLRATDRSVDVYVHKLRTKLADALPGWRLIHTHFGLGYRLAPEPPAGPRRTNKRERIQ
jgi:DNA-binding response OmpR family regulator